MTETADVVIVGGGVMGAATAYFLAADPGFDGRVVVLERDPTYARSSTARSVGSIRLQFSTPTNIRLSQFGIAFLRGVGETLAVDGVAPAVSYRERGYLFLASTPAQAAVLRENLAVQADCGVTEVAAQTPEQLAARFAWLAVDDIALGGLGLAGEGWFDPYALLQAFKAKARALGAVFRAEAAVAIAREGRRATGVTTASGARIAAGAVVNAAGPWAASVATMAGVALPVAPKKRQVFVLACRTPMPGMPLVIDPSGLYVRPEGASYLCGMSPPEDADPDAADDDETVDHGWFEETLWPILARRIPAFEAAKVEGGWVGRYEMNRIDQNGLIGRHPDLDNFYCANGFSGHGVQQAAGVGRGLAELIAHGRYVTLDLSELGVERIADGRVVRERNVV